MRYGLSGYSDLQKKIGREEYFLRKHIADLESVLERLKEFEGQEVDIILQKNLDNLELLTWKYIWSYDQIAKQINMFIHKAGKELVSRYFDLCEVIDEELARIDTDWISVLSYPNL
ncbi:MAG: hypothetical protein AABX66_01820 [Nanoarchaeota archaeon]